MKVRHLLPLIILTSSIFAGLAWTSEWGFFGHRRINRMAVFTLPPDMMHLYKKNIDYLTDHAVDPDKRRYATKHEAVRHYIDIDHWGTFPFDNIPRNWTDVLMKFTDVYMVSERGDTLQILGREVVDFGKQFINLKNPDLLKRSGPDPVLERKVYRQFFTDLILPQYYEDDWFLDCEVLNDLLSKTGLRYNCNSVVLKDRFSEYGILPYHLISMQRRLTKAFADGDSKKILRLSAEFGHYIGDAHVPLHTEL